MPNNYEIHIGFADDDLRAASAVHDRLQELQGGWSLSTVSSVHSDVEIEDPHNVPGTLGALLSKDYPSNALEIMDSLSADLACVFQLLEEMEVPNARVELEFVTGYSHQRMAGEPVVLYTWPLPNVALDTAFEHFENVPQTPNSEIHFVIEREVDLPLAADEQMTPLEASHLIELAGVKIQQTIEYTSRSMREAGITQPKIICTSYYDCIASAEKGAQELLDQKDLVGLFRAKGYKIKLVIERILACFAPSLPMVISHHDGTDAHIAVRS